MPSTIVMDSSGPRRSKPSARSCASPLADLYGTVTFYHHFAREDGGLQRPRVCTGPVCRQRGALEIVESLDGAEEMPCSGRCDDPVPLLIGHETFVVSPPLHTLQRRISSPMPVPNPGGREECVFAEIRQPERDSLDGYPAQRRLRRPDPGRARADPDRHHRRAQGVEAGRPRRRRIPHRHEVAVRTRGAACAQEHRLQRR